ncbi:hypothetical protein QJS10_CPA09g01139 [Acorus calamus]|uniref:Uncharacterized protein n=1 Tax=Acorus calamus TaxID=4465 RepID=A0AAV9E398_ACOCL|nr:hypothetical protein QJS10_CPA09g01139 [Acorus calamus]
MAGEGSSVGRAIGDGSNVPSGGVHGQGGQTVWNALNIETTVRDFRSQVKVGSLASQSATTGGHPRVDTSRADKHSHTESLD